MAAQRSGAAPGRRLSISAVEVAELLASAYNAMQHAESDPAAADEAAARRDDVIRRMYGGGLTVPEISVLLGLASDVVATAIAA